MLQFVVPIFVLTGLVLILVGSDKIGRIYAFYHLKNDPKHKLEIVSVAESSVFGLLALLIAFTFSGAYERYEHRKLHLIKEANAFQKAYDFIDTAPEQYQAALRGKVRVFFDLHIAAFKAIPYLNRVDADLLQAQLVQKALWDAAIIAANDTPHQSLAQSMLEAISTMFETAYAGQKLTRIHPPPVIFVLMIGLSALGAFLIGYDSAQKANTKHIHIACYIIITAFTVYLIMNLEFPRIGFIRMEYFDQMLVSVRAAMT